MATVVLPGLPGSAIITFEYDATGLAWVILHDNAPVCWLVDDTGATPPVPMIIGSMPPAPPATGAVLSPLWGQVFAGGTLFIPDIIRGTPNAVFTWLATNHGANRQLYANFAATGLAVSWQQWAANNPTRALAVPPNLAPPTLLEAEPPMMPALRGAKTAEAMEETG